MYYETAELNDEQAAKFKAWFDAEINTDCEENDNEDGTFYYFCSDLTSSEVKKVRAFEISLTAEKPPAADKPTIEETEKACFELFGF